MWSEDRRDCVVHVTSRVLGGAKEAVGDDVGAELEVEKTGIERS